MPHTIPLKLLVTIVDRGKGSTAVNLYRAHALHFEYLCMGLGTAKSKTLDYFGLAETEKDVVLTLIPAPKVRRIIELSDQKFGLSRPGHGILFTIPLSGISRHIPMVLCKPENMSQTEGPKEESAMEASIRYDLILVIVNRGYTDTVMDAARSAGAGGGTVLHAKGTGRARAQKFFGVSLADEKDVVYIVAHADEKAAIMQAIADNAGPGTRAGAICFSLPISQVAGLRERDE